VNRPLSLWQIYVDLLTARVLLGIAPGAAALLSPEDHRFLGERYAQLAARWRHAGWRARADALAARAQAHIAAARGDDPPPAVAVAMPRRVPVVVVEARGRQISGPWSSPSSPSRPLRPSR
jgi:hypothetical protein